MIRKYSKKGLEKKKEKAEATRKLHEWFLTIFDKRKKKDGNGYYVTCFETGRKMYEEWYRENSCIYSHCYPKAKYPEFAMEEWNLLIVLPDIHAQWEADRRKTPKMKEYFETVALKHFNDGKL